MEKDIFGTTNKFVVPYISLCKEQKNKTTKKMIDGETIRVWICLKWKKDFVEEKVV